MKALKTMKLYKAYLGTRPLVTLKQNKYIWGLGLWTPFWVINERTSVVHRRTSGTFNPSQIKGNLPPWWQFFCDIFTK